MRLLLDEDTPAQLVGPLEHILFGHEIKDIRTVGWSGKKDPQVMADAKRAGYHVILTNDKSQLTSPDLCDAIKKSGLHHVRYDQGPGTLGLALALAAIIAAMPRVMEDLAMAKGQRLIKIKSLERAPIRHVIPPWPSNEPGRRSNSHKVIALPKARFPRRVRAATGEQPGSPLLVGTYTRLTGRGLHTAAPCWSQAAMPAFSQPARTMLPPTSAVLRPALTSVTRRTLTSRYFGTEHHLLQAVYDPSA